MQFWFKNLTVAAGSTLAILGLAVLVGWHTQASALIQVHPSFVPMQYNTAVGFFLSGLGLLSVVYGFPRLATACGAVVAALGILTLFQYVFAVDLGIDQLLMKHYITVKTSHPGRMAPNTALCFSFTGFALLIHERLRGHRRTSLLMGTLGSLVLGLSFVAASGYAMGLETVYGWGALTQMALHTSLGFIVLGIGLFSVSWSKEFTVKAGLPSWLPSPVGIGVLTIVVSLWQAIHFNPSEGGQTEQLFHYLFLAFGILLAAAMAWATNRVLMARKSEERYEFAISGSNEGIWDWNIVTGDVVFDQNWPRIFGYSPDEIKPNVDTWKNMLHPDDKAEVTKALNDHFEGRTPNYVSEHRMKNKDGEWIWILDCGKVAERDDNGKPLRMVGRDSDITERRQAEKALRENEEHLRTLVQNIATAVIVHAPDTSIIAINEKALELLGITEDQAQGRLSIDPNWAFLNIDGTSMPIDMYPINQVIASGETLRKMELGIIRPTTGDVVWVIASAVPLFKEGRIKDVVVSFMDITERKQVEEQLQNLTHDLRKRVKEQTGLYSLSKILSEYDSSIEDVMETVVKIIPPAWHYPETTCARITIGDLVFSTENFKKTAWRQASDIVVNEKSMGQIEVFILEEVPELDEGPFLKEERALIHQMAERIGGHIEHKQTEEHLRRTQKMDAVGQMVGGIAHDFNNILGIVMGNLEILRDEVGEEFGNRVGVAMKGAKRGAELTRKLLAFSRHDNVETKVIWIADVIDGMSDLLQKSLTPAIEIKRSLADDLWPVKVNPDDFEDVIVNLALNARDAMPNGGKLVIEAENKKLDEGFTAPDPDIVAGDYVLVSVEDTGIGMTSEVVEKAFDPFFSTKKEGKGTGLGLSMVYGFVKRSGGHIKIYSEPGEGTRIRICLPRSTDAVEALTEPAEEVELPRGTETVLVVDDEAQLVDVCVHHLESLGYQTLSANSGEEALEVLASGKNVDVLFSDIVMHGGMDGYELTKKALKQHPTLKVLLTTGFTTKHEDVLVKRLSPSSQLMKKPYTKSELARNIRQVLDS